MLQCSRSRVKVVADGKYVYGLKVTGADGYVSGIMRGKDLTQCLDEKFSEGYFFANGADNQFRAIDHGGRSCTLTINFTRVE